MQSGVGVAHPTLALYGRTEREGNDMIRRMNSRIRTEQAVSDRGASLVEYALLVALIAVVCVVAVTYFGGETQETFSRVGESVQTS